MISKIGSIRCPKCGRIWVAACEHIETTEVECPTCGFMVSIKDFVVGVAKDTTRNEYKFEVTMQSPSTKPEEVQEAIKRQLSYIAGEFEVKPLEQHQKEEWFEHEFLVKFKSTSSDKDTALSDLIECIVDNKVPLNLFDISHFPGSQRFPTFDEFERFSYGIRSIEELYDFFTKPEKTS
jgi:DNA-directed RNA polymerase subunit RPC12/RpoP